MIITKKFWCIDVERFAKFFDESTSVQSPPGLFSLFLFPSSAAITTKSRGALIFTVI